MTTSGSDGIDAMDDAWRVAVLDRLAEEGLKLTDPEQQDTIIGMLDAVAFQLSANWLGWLVDQTDDLAILDERLGIFGSVLATLIERELEQALLGPAYVALDNETFRSLVVLSLATVKYIDWQAQAQAAGLAEDADETGALFAAADEAIGAVITRAASFRLATGDTASYIATLTPSTFISALLIAIQEQSERLGLGIFI